MILESSGGFHPVRPSRRGQWGRGIQYLSAQELRMRRVGSEQNESKKLHRKLMKVSERF